MWRIGFDNVTGYLDGGMLTLRDRDDLLAVTPQASADAVHGWVGAPDAPYLLDAEIFEAIDGAGFSQPDWKLFARDESIHFAPCSARENPSDRRRTIEWRQVFHGWIGQLSGDVIQLAPSVVVQKSADNHEQ